MVGMALAVAFMALGATLSQSSGGLAGQFGIPRPHRRGDLLSLNHHGPGEINKGRLVGVRHILKGGQAAEHGDQLGGAIELSTMLLKFRCAGGMGGNELAASPVQQLHQRNQVHQIFPGDCRSGLGWQ